MSDLEFIRPASRPGDKRRWLLSPIDIYAFRWLIQGTWIFNADIDAELLKQGLSRLLDAYPILCGRRLSLFYTNSFQKFPVYDLEFGGNSGLVQPVRVVPHNLGDAILFWPSPPSVGGIELYFSGTLAHTVKALKDTDPWWYELRCFDAP